MAHVSVPPPMLLVADGHDSCPQMRVAAVFCVGVNVQVIVAPYPATALLPLLSETSAVNVVLPKTCQQGDAEQHKLTGQSVIVGGALVVAAVC